MLAPIANAGNYFDSKVSNWESGQCIDQSRLRTKGGRKPHLAALEKYLKRQLTITPVLGNS